MILDPDTNRLAAARQAVALGKPVVGLAGTVAPMELVAAAGCHALPLMARAADFGADSAPMEDGHEPEVRSLFIQATAGDFDLCATLVMPSASDGHRYLFQYLKEMQRQGRGDAIPPLEPYDFLFGPSAPVRRYSRRVLDGLAARLVVVSGAPIGDDALAAAIDEANAVRRALARLDALRRAGRVDGSVAHRAIRAGAFAEPVAYRAVLEAWVGTLEAAPVDAASVAGASAPARAARPRWLVVSAVPLYHEQFHLACEAAGADVVAEDDEWGTRRGAGQVATTGAPLDALFAHYSEHAVSPRMLQPQREAWVRATMAAGGIDAVVFYVPPSDQFFGWRYPALKHAAAVCGLPTLLVRGEALDAAALPAIVDQLAAFAAQQGGRP